MYMYMLADPKYKDRTTAVIQEEEPEMTLCTSSEAFVLSLSMLLASACKNAPIVQLEYVLR